MEYHFNKNNTVRNEVNEAILQNEITSQLTGFINLINQPNNIIVIFESELSTNNQQTLNQIIFEHDSNINKLPERVSIAEQTPFAKPEYRTKRNGTDTWQSLTESSNLDIDFLLTEERYVTGGEIIYKDAKEGDYITAEIVDKDNVIPEPYRAVLCENHPIVASYVEKKWLKPCSGYDSFEINTYPLNAKISAGLYLRVTYYSSSEVGERRVAINYHLSKKL